MAAGEGASPFDKLRVRTTEAPVEILMLNLSKPRRISGPQPARSPAGLGPPVAQSSSSTVWTTGRAEPEAS